MAEIIRKAGDVLVTVNVVPARSMAAFVPEGARIHELLPGMACYAVGLFHYSRLYDPRPGQETNDFHDCYDAGILIPVEYPGRKTVMHVMRLCNSDPAVVEWAESAHLAKRGVAVEWTEKDGRIDVVATAENNERYVTSATPLMPLPGAAWRMWPFSLFARGHMAREQAGRMWAFAFHVGTGGAKSWLVRGKSRLEGFDLPKPWMSTTVLVRGFTPFTMWEGEAIG
jgi:hypothetical protein